MRTKMFLSTVTSLVVSAALASACFAQNAPCPYTLTPPNQFVGAAGGPPSNIADVTTAPGCLWTAVSNVPWIRVVFGSVGTGSGHVSYTVAANPGPNRRRGTMTVAGKKFTVSQETPVPMPCTIAIPLGATVNWIHFTHRFSITASTDTCPWQVQSSVPWITLRSSASGKGSILFVFDIEENSGTGNPPRVGRILVNGKDFLVTQKSQ